MALGGGEFTSGGSSYVKINVLDKTLENSQNSNKKRSVTPTKQRGKKFESQLSNSIIKENLNSMRRNAEHPHCSQKEASCQLTNCSCRLKSYFDHEEAHGHQ
jgi:hypothetical protein